jgi:hypothetical protein
VWIHVWERKFTNGSSQNFHSYLQTQDTKFYFIFIYSFIYLFLRWMNKVDWMALLIFHSCKVFEALACFCLVREYTLIVSQNILKKAFEKVCTNIFVQHHWRHVFWSSSHLLYVG